MCCLLLPHGYGQWFVDSHSSEGRRGYSKVEIRIAKFTWSRVSKGVSKGHSVFYELLLIYLFQKPQIKFCVSKLTFQIRSNLDKHVRIKISEIRVTQRFHIFSMTSDFELLRLKILKDSLCKMSRRHQNVELLLRWFLILKILFPCTFKFLRIYFS